MTDIVERLRAMSDGRCEGSEWGAGTCAAAADEIERLRDQIYESIPRWQANELQREIERLRADYEKLGKSVAAWIDSYGALKEDYARLERALQDIANVSMSQFVRASDLADYQMATARTALATALNGGNDE